MPQVGPLEILVIFVVALVVFGPKEIPKVARQAAKAWREVQRFQANVRRDIDEVLRDDEDDDQGGSPPPTLPPKPVVKQPELETDATPPADTTS
jgi:sec-independent protein translocase protein TatB